MHKGRHTAIMSTPPSVPFKQINTHCVSLSHTQTHTRTSRLSKALSECSHLQSVIAFTSTNSVYKGCFSSSESPRCSVTQTVAVNILPLLLNSTTVTVVIYKPLKLHLVTPNGKDKENIQMFTISPLNM